MASATSTLRSTFFLLKPPHRLPPSSLFTISIPKTLHHHSRRSYQLTRTFSSSQSSHRYRPNVVEILEQRGLLDSVTGDNLRTVCSHLSLRVYCGFDPTAESLHLGNLIGIIVLSWFLRSGHSVVPLLGGATGRVGEPSGKSLERPELDVLTLERNISGISQSIVKILNQIENPNPNNSVAVLNNYDWWKDVTLLDFMKNVGRFGTLVGLIR